MLLLAALGLGPLQAQSPGKPAVPESWKQSNGGPYVQGPDGLWWVVSPFNPQPWRAFQPATQLPAGFAEIFGPEPKAPDFQTGLLFQAALDAWRQELKQFRQAGLPEWADRAQVEGANRVYEAWEMGALLLFEGRYGCSARFARARSYEFAARTAIELPHLVVATYQVSEIQQGRAPARKHPFVPPLAWPDFKPDPQAHTGP